MPLQKGFDIKRICILDDNPLILMTLKRALNAPGYEIFSVSTREEFAELLEKYSNEIRKKVAELLSEKKDES